MLKAQVLNLTISKRKNLCLPLKVETDQFVFCLVLPECLSLKICCISPSDSEANRDGSDAESPFPLFFSPLRTLAREKRSENCLVGQVCLYLLLSRNIIFCPALTMAARAKKNFLAKRFAHAISARVHYRDLEHAYAIKFSNVRVLRISIVHSRADDVSKSLCQKFFFSRERPSLAWGKIIRYFATIMDTNRDPPFPKLRQFPTFSLRLEFLNEAEKEKNNG